VTDTPDLATIRTLTEHPVRTAMLLALLDGRGRTATELGDVAETSRAVASIHLAHLLDGRILRVHRQGRHRYFRLADREIAGLLRSLAIGSERSRVIEQHFGPRSARMRYARMCYDHVAGTLGIGVVEGLVRLGALVEGDDCFDLTQHGERFLCDFGVNVSEARRSQRYFARACIDWSERRPHLAGALGAAVTDRLFALRWIDRDPRGRTLTITPSGAQGILSTFGIETVEPYPDAEAGDESESEWT
jgi:DNA-binding transcriptional ArsR family regulator